VDIRRRGLICEGPRLTHAGVSNRAIIVITLILAAAGIYACWCGAALTWDGAYQFCWGLLKQRPYVYGARFHSWIVWLPFIGVSRVTHSLALLRVVFGLPFALAPAAGLILSWWVVRRDAPHLIVWALFGIAIAPLPGQIFIINDSIFQQHLFWPVFLGLFVSLSPAKRAVLGGLALLQLSHPIGIVLLAVAVVAASLLAWQRPDERGRLTWLAVLLTALAMAGALKMLIWPDQQAADEFHLAVALNRWRKGVYGAPIGGLRWFWLAGAMVFLSGWLNPQKRPRLVRWLGAGALVAAACGAALWLGWAADERRWAFALDYRRWFVPLALPFYGLCVLEALRRSTWAGGDKTTADAPAVRTRTRLSYLLAGTFAAVLSVQSVLWGLMTQRLLEEAKHYPSVVIPRSALPWIEGTPMQHWATMSYLIALQGTTPGKLFLYDPADGAKLNANPPGIPLAPDDWGKVPPEPGPRGWFDFRPLLEELHPRDTGFQPVLTASGVQELLIQRPSTPNAPRTGWKPVSRHDAFTPPRHRSPPPVAAHAPWALGRNTAAPETPSARPGRPGRWRPIGPGH
jgi:hypothetical protein